MPLHDPYVSKPLEPLSTKPCCTCSGTCKAPIVFESIPGHSELPSCTRGVASSVSGPSLLPTSLAKGPSESPPVSSPSSQELSQSASQQSYVQSSVVQLDKALLSSPLPSAIIISRGVGPDSLPNKCFSGKYLCQEEIMVVGCFEIVFPTMWHSHMSLHAGSIFLGEDYGYLTRINSFAPSVTNLYLTQQQHCRSRVNTMGPAAIPPNPPSLPSNQGIPSLEEVFQLCCPTLRFIPTKSRSVFAQVLSSTLRSVVSKNSVWFKLFMLPKRLLPSSRRMGRHIMLISVDHLCDLWSKHKLNLLWKAMANATSRPHDVHAGDTKRLILSCSNWESTQRQLGRLAIWHTIILVKSPANEIAAQMSKETPIL